MRLKPHILTVASTATLRQIVEDFELSVPDKRKRQALIDAISSSRRCQPEDLLGYLGEPEVKQVCEAAGVDSRGRKNALIARLVEAASPASAPVTTPPQPSTSHPKTFNHLPKRTAMTDQQPAQASLQLASTEASTTNVEKYEFQPIKGYSTTRTNEFVDIAVERFLTESSSLRPEGMLPKLAFFAATIDELTTELKPAVERALAKHGIPASRILVNVGDDKLTTNDDIREFNRLDTEASEKQFILLVNKGREGWNCRSLFGVGLFREPKSRVFVLQATMRCLRAVGQAQHTGHVFLSNENLAILNDELQQNFRISAEELQKVASNRERVEVRVVEPPVKIKLVRVRRQYAMRERPLVSGQALGLDRTNNEAWSTLVEKYRLIETQQDGLNVADAARSANSRTFDLTSRREKRAFSRMTLVAEVSRYLNHSPLQIEDLLDSTKEGTDELVAMTNEFNELLYDEIIPRLFRQLYDLDESQQTEEHEVELIKMPPNGYYEVTAAKDKIVRRGIG